MLPEETSKFSKIAQISWRGPLRWGTLSRGASCLLHWPQWTSYCVLHVVCVCDIQKPKHRCQGPCIFLYHELIFLVRQSESLFWTPFWYHWLARGEYFRFPTSFPYFLTCWILYLRHKCCSFMQQCSQRTVGVPVPCPPCPSQQAWQQDTPNPPTDRGWAVALGMLPTKHQHINTLVTGPRRVPFAFKPWRVNVKFLAFQWLTRAASIMCLL